MVIDAGNCKKRVNLLPEELARLDFAVKPILSQLEKLPIAIKMLLRATIPAGEIAERTNARAHGIASFCRAVCRCGAKYVGKDRHS